MAALKYWLWLSSAGLSLRARAALLERYGDAERIFFAPEGSYEATAGVSKAEAALLEQRDLRLAQELPDLCEEQNIRILSLQDAAYPQRLKHIYSPPVVLYVKGRLPLLDSRAPIAVIGTRHNSAYGVKMGAQLAGEIASCGGAVVSLLTSDIEQAAAEAALRADGLCIGVLGVPHEREVRRLAADVAGYGALISEYPPGMRPVNSFFRERNRIAAGLSVGVLVVEAPEKSGTQLFVAEAAEQGKEIFAVPGAADTANSVGTNRFIQEGAKLVTSGWEVMCEYEALFPQTVHPPKAEARKAETPPLARKEKTAAKPKCPDSVPKASPDVQPKAAPRELSEQLAGLSEAQLKIIAALDQRDKHIDDIIEETGLSTAAVLAQLTVLEIKGFVTHRPGRRFSLNITKK